MKFTPTSIGSMARVLRTARSVCRHMSAHLSDALTHTVAAVLHCPEHDMLLELLLDAVLLRLGILQHSQAGQVSLTIVWGRKLAC